jgi:hypothetical protein
MFPYILFAHATELTFNLNDTIIAENKFVKMRRRARARIRIRVRKRC